MTERGNLRFDLGFVCFALCFAVLVHITAVSPESGGTRYISSDAQQLVSFAAALDHPDAFSRDPLLSDARNFGWYESLHVPLIRLVAQGKEYGLAYEKLTGAHQFVHLTGFYLLGLCFLRRRLFAALFAVVVSLEFWFGWGTYWGSLRAGVPLPRVTYTALFSLLCAAMLTVRRDCRFWPFIFFGMGALVYAHAVSALGMGFAMWLGLLYFRPAGFSRTRHFAHMLLAGLCFLVPLIPFIMNFLGYAGAGASDGTHSVEDLRFLREIAAWRFEETFTRLGPQLLNFLAKISTQPPILPLALWGAWAARRWGNERERELVPLLGLWACGIIVTVCAFALDQELARRLERPPLEYDMVRCIRFIPFFCFISAFSGLSALWESGAASRFRLARFLPAGLTLLVAVLFLLQGAVRSVLFLVFPHTQAWEARLAEERANGELVAALAEHTEPGAKIFTEDGDFLVRYGALRNLAFSHKDGGIFLYANRADALRVWRDAALDLDNGSVPGRTRRQGVRPAPALYEEYARRTDSDYLVLSADSDLSGLKASVPVRRTARHILLRTTKENGSAAHGSAAR